MPGFDLNAFDSQFGTSGAPMLNTSNGVAPKANSGPGFFSDLAHSAVAVGKAVGDAVAQPLEQAGHTAVSVLNPAPAIRSARVLAAEATGNKKAEANAIRAQQTAKPDFIQNEYGQGNVKSLENAAEFATTAATLAAPGISAEAPVAETLAGKAGSKVIKVAKDVVGAGKTVSKNPIIATAGKAVRNVAVSQPTVQMPGQVANDVKTGNYGDLALNAAVPLVGAGALKVAPGVAKIVSDLFRNDRGIGNTLQFKNGTIQGVLHDLQAKAASGDAQAAKQYSTMYDQAKVAIDHMSAEGRTPDEIAAYQRFHGNPTEIMTVKDFLQQNSDLATAENTFKGMAKAGHFTFDSAGEKPIPENMISRVGAGKFDQSEKADLIQRLSPLTPAERAQVFVQDEARGKAYTQNPNVYAKVQQAAINADPGKMAAEIHDVTGTQPLKVKPTGSPTLDKMNAESTPKLPKVPGGYIPIIKPESAAGFREAGTIEDNVDTAKRGVLAPVSEMARKAGLSLGASNPKATKIMLKTNFAANLQDLGVSGDAEKILKALDAQVSNTKGAFDARALTRAQIDNAVRNVAPDVKATDIQKAYRAAIAQLPTSETGMAQSVINKTIGKSTTFNKYMQAQAIGRYEANPIFWAKQSIKGSIIALAEGAKLGVSTSDESMLALKKAGLLSDTARGGSDYSASSETSSAAGKLMRTDQQKIVGWLASSIADAHGTTVKQILNDGGALADQMKESLSLVHSYGSGSYLNSPFAKTLNTIIYPSRFATKVGIEAGKALSKMPVAAQIATLHSIAKGAQVFNSPEGKQWQRDNSELVGIIKYFTPATELSSVATFLDNGFHPGDLGQLGGLPVGVIATLLTDQGINIGQQSSQYFNPKTGQPVPSAIPTTLKARLQTGLSSLIGTLFSYPGKTVGLPSKKAVIQLGGKNPLTTPAAGETQNRYANGSTTAPAPQPGANTPTTTAPKSTPSVLSTPVQTRPVKLTTAPSVPARAKKSKTVPLSQQLPGSAAIAAGTAG